MTVAQGTPNCEPTWTECPLCKNNFRNMPPHCRMRGGVAQGTPNVERFNNWCALTHHHEMAPHASGLWVRYSDYAALSAQLVELQAEISDAYSLAYNLDPERTEDTAKDTLCEQIEVLGSRVHSTVTRASVPPSVKDSGT